MIVCGRKEHNILANFVIPMQRAFCSVIHSLPFFFVDINCTLSYVRVKLILYMTVFRI